MSDRHQDWPARLRLHPSAFVAPGATVVGEVALGECSSVWFGTVVRGDTAPITVGARSNLQDLTLVHVDADAPAVVGDRVTVGHRAILHGCTVGDDCLIGMGAIVLSKAVVGPGSLVGAGALVTEGQVIPAGSLVLGAPARVLGPVREPHRAAIAEGTRHYVELSRAYLRKGFARAHPAPGHEPGITPGGPGPMRFAEWGACLGVLAEGPDHVADRLAAAPGRERARPAPGRWSALEVLAHLRDADRDVFALRLESFLARPGEPLPDADLEAAERLAVYAALDPAAVLDEWRRGRAALLARLAPLGSADWGRVGLHPRAGTQSLAEMVRDWVDHDLSHRRQLALALGLAP